MLPHQGQGEEQRHADDDHQPATAAPLRPCLSLILSRRISWGCAAAFARIQEAAVLCRCVWLQSLTLSGLCFCRKLDMHLILVATRGMLWVRQRCKQTRQLRGKVVSGASWSGQCQGHCCKMG